MVVVRGKESHEGEDGTYLKIEHGPCASSGPGQMTLNVVLGARLWIVERAARTMDTMSDVGNAPQGLPKMASEGLNGTATHKPSGIITRVYMAPACLTHIMNSARENQSPTILLMPTLLEC